MLTEGVELTGIGPRVKRVKNMSVIAGVHGALPPHRYTQSEVTHPLTELIGGAATHPRTELQDLEPLPSNTIGEF